ncbi:MAG: LacI family DNA-binding transcriptional regulator [Acidobacteriaceae bacterium]|nr:LacI family DNA-binding transcriptional regulator [Acidobacteriaceae bacterium]
MAVSIKDIARIAGVSHSTVSRALRNSPLIPERTARRIQQIARERGYSASAVARSLVTRKTQTMGVVVTSIADPFNGEIVEGIEEAANQSGYSVILATSQADPEREMAVVRSFQERRVDGILVASSRVGSLYMPLLGEMEIPIVLLNNQSAGTFAHAVTIDNVDGAFQATWHLLQLGHRRIAYIGDRFGLQSDVERLKGYRKALTQAGLTFSEKLVAHGDGKSRGAREAAARLFGSHLARDRQPTAIFCYNDMSALGVMEHAEAAGVRIPQDLSIVGFDDLFFASQLRPPLTTVRQPKKEIGRRAMQHLLALVRGEQPGSTTVIKGELIVRGSTAPRS